MSDDEAQESRDEFYERVICEAEIQHEKYGQQCVHGLVVGAVIKAASQDHCLTHMLDVLDAARVLCSRLIEIETGQTPIGPTIN